MLRACKNRSLSVAAYRRSAGETWLLTTHDTCKASVTLSLDMSLPMAQPYEGVEFEVVADCDVV